MMAAHMEEASFQSPKNFDALDYVMHSLAMTPSTWYVEVGLYLPLAEAQQRIPAMLAVLEDKGKYVLLRCYAQDLEWMASILAGLHCQLVVIQPPELRCVLQQLATRITTIAEATENSG
jgi:hypothetical protein